MNPVTLAWIFGAICVISGGIGLYIDRRPRTPEQNKAYAITTKATWQDLPTYLYPISMISGAILFGLLIAIANGL